MNIEKTAHTAMNYLPMHMQNEVTNSTVRSITTAIMVAISEQLESRAILKVKRSDDAKQFPLIHAKKAGDVGYDLPAIFPYSVDNGDVNELITEMINNGSARDITEAERALRDSIIINPGERGVVPTGIFLEIPEGYWASIEARSSTSQKMLQVPKGVIDEGYRGELFAVLLNTGNEPVEIFHGDRYVQLIMHKRENASIDIVEVDELSASERGDTGFGSTGQSERSGCTICPFPNSDPNDNIEHID